MKVKISLITLILLLTGCAYNASMVQTFYNSLSVSQTTYDTSMKVVANLYQRGEITNNEKIEILNVAQTYHDAHNAAVRALLNYEHSKNLSDLDLVEHQLSAATTSLTDLLNLIRPYIGG